MIPMFPGIPWSRYSCLLLGLACLSGCRDLSPTGHGWGEGAFTTISASGVGRAFCRAALDPQVLAPAAGAAIFGVDDLDRQTSDWAISHTPMYGAGKTASETSDYLWQILGAEAVVTGLTAPAGETVPGWGWDKVRGGAVEGSAYGASSLVAGWLKDGVGRERPNGKNDKSFPSGHAIQAASGAALSDRNLHYFPGPETVVTALQAVNTGATYACAWARVEAGKHYPSDVLAGIAIGRWVSLFIHDALMGLPENHPLTFDIQLEKAAALCGITYRF